MRKLLAIVAGFVLLVGQIQAQTNRTVTGKVTDDKGVPLVGVTVSASAERRTLTDNGGNFSISVSDKVKSLRFSYVGYNAADVVVTGKTSLTVSMTAEDKSLSEVVVVGYGTQKKRESVGSVASVKGEALAEKPIQSFEAGLAGRAAGVQITVPSGVLNAPPVFRVRGTNSISLSTTPLIIVDGVVSPTGDVGGTNSPANPLASINPNDIESIDIAKDAAATAIYGSRAANGVVFITTKRGKTGKAKVSYDGWVGWTSAYGLPKMLDAFQYTDFKNQALANYAAFTAANPTYKFALTNGPNGQPINTNWNDYVYRRGVSQSHNLSVSGGNENTNYYLSVGYTDQQGIIQKNNFKRTNILFNIDSRVSKTVTVGGKLSFSNEKNLSAATSGSLAGEAFNSAGLARLALVNAPNVSPYNNDGTYNIGPTYVGPMNNVIAGGQVGFFNPVVLLDLSRSNTELNHIQSNAYFQYKPVSWLTLKTVYGIDYTLIDNDLFQNPVHGDGQAANGNASSSHVNLKTSVWTTTGQFDYTFANKHNVSVLVGGEEQRRTTLGYGINRQTLSDPAYTVIQAGFTINNSTGQQYGENYLLSSFGRLTYNYDKKYFLSGNVRQDEYSALGVKKGTFWGASLAWDITKENFWQKAHMDNIFSSLKLKGSYGKVGNIGGIGDYSSYSLFNSGLYGGTATLSFPAGQVGNPTLQWETSKKTDLGFTFGILKDRINGEFAYYYNNINNLILNVPQAPSAGLPNNPLQNVGTMYNRGFEFTLNATPVMSKDFSWNSSFNISFNKNMVTSLAPGLSVIQTSTSGSETVSETLPGYSLGYLWVIRTAGVDAATGRRIFVNSAGTPVSYQFNPTTATNVATNTVNYFNADGSKYVGPGGATAISQGADAVLYKNTQPRQYGGWDNTFNYKGFSLNVLLTYQLGFYVYYGTNAGTHDQRFWNNAVDILDRWQKAGDVAKWPKPIYGDNVSNGSAMPLDINVFKGDFVKVRNVSVSYSLPKKILDRVKISNARIYVSGQNLAIITKYPGPDPEVSSNGTGNTSQGVDRNTAANGRTITLGVNIGF